MTPLGLIPVASLPIAPGGSNEVKTLLLNRKECWTPEVSQEVGLQLTVQSARLRIAIASYGFSPPSQHENLRFACSKPH